MLQDSSQRSLLVSRSSRSAFTVCPSSASSISALAHGGSSSSGHSGTIGSTSFTAAPKPQSPLRPVSPPLRRRVSSSLRSTLGAVEDHGGSLSGMSRSQSKELNTEVGLLFFKPQKFCASNHQSSSYQWAMISVIDHFGPLTQITAIRDTLHWCILTIDHPWSECNQVR